ncbi:MazG-like protein [Chryseobacterium sp. C39-AII1]|uniref:MazG-like protein n=1 Tax=Chryseobacterium sp. C39-AII1 TaxID=3080332 RepID=UPI00320A92BC
MKKLIYRKMEDSNFYKIIERSLEIREKYHQLEIQQNGKEWTLEQDALAYLTDAGLIGRNVMSHEKTWSKKNSTEELEHKLGENIWWLIILANKTGIDINEAVEKFLTKTENILK